MYSREEIEKELRDKHGTWNDKGIRHVAYNILDIQDKILNENKLKGKFVTCVVEGDWERAHSVADSLNKQVMDHYDTYQEWIKKIYKSPEFREKRLSKLLDNITL